MSEQDMNDQLVLICGLSAAGKSASLRKIRNQPKWMYLNTEAGKRLPFANQFWNLKITDPLQVLEAFDHAIANPDKVDGIIIDSITFLMEQYESQYVLTAANTMGAWSNYQQFFKTLLQQKVAQFGKPVIITAHILETYDEGRMEFKSAVPIKGALKANGVEAYFSTVVMAKKVDLKELEAYGSDLLTIDEDDTDLGFKHVFQTRPTKKTAGDKIRSPMGMFTKAQTYMDNDAQRLLDHLQRYYHPS